MITLTTEQAQQIEEALDELRYANNTDIAKTKYYKALSIIRTARAQEQAEQEPVNEAQQELLDALNRVLRWVDDWCDTGPETGFEIIEKQASAAIAKATGENNDIHS